MLSLPHLPPLPAPLQAFLVSAQQWVQHQSGLAACAAINHLLALEPNLAARLAAHDGRSVLLTWDAVAFTPAGEYALTITDQNVHPNTFLNTNYDVRIHVQAGVLAAPEAEKLRFIRIEGDALLAQDLGFLAQHLRWDVEHDLAARLGDAPALFLVKHGRIWGAALFAAAQALQTDAKRAGVLIQSKLAGLNPMASHSVVTATELAAHAQELADLASRIADLERSAPSKV